MTAAHILAFASLATFVITTLLYGITGRLPIAFVSWAALAAGLAILNSTT